MVAYASHLFCLLFGVYGLWWAGLEPQLCGWLHMQFWEAMVQGLWFAVIGLWGGQVWKHHRATSCIYNLIGCGSWLIVAVYGLAGIGCGTAIVVASASLESQAFVFTI